MMFHLTLPQQTLKPYQLIFISFIHFNFILEFTPCNTFVLCIAYKNNNKKNPLKRKMDYFVVFLDYFVTKINLEFPELSFFI